MERIAREKEGREGDKIPPPSASQSTFSSDDGDAARPDRGFHISHTSPASLRCSTHMKRNDVHELAALCSTDFDGGASIGIAVALAVLGMMISTARPTLLPLPGGTAAAAAAASGGVGVVALASRPPPGAWFGVVERA